MNRDDSYHSGFELTAAEIVGQPQDESLLFPDGMLEPPLPFVSSSPSLPDFSLSGAPLSPQQAGLHLLDTLLQIASQLDLPSPDDEVLMMAFHTLEVHINVLFEAEAQLVLFGHAGCFFLNKTPLHLDPASRWTLASCWKRLEQKDLGGLMVMGATTFAQVCEFFRQLMSPTEVPKATTTLFPLSKENAIARITFHEREALARRALERAEPTGFMLNLYAQLLQWVQQRYNPLQPKPARRIAARILQELAARCEGRPVLFLGFRADKDAASYQGHHIANTALLAMLFGESLGLNRSQRLELALVTLDHEVGKLDLPPELLQKSGPLSEDERKSIEMLPIHTVRRLLKHRFDWSRLKHALIALDVRLRPVQRASSSNSSLRSAFAADPSLFFSRIISLCACFDALCAARPFRPAMGPDEALCFMRSTLADQFDPSLLQRFVAYLIPAIQEATGRILHPLPPPDDQRKLDKKFAPPVIQELQRELKEYHTLKRIPRPSEEEQQRLDYLKKYLVWKLKAAASA